MSPHEAAHSVGWFVIVVFLGIAYVLWRDYCNETKDKATSRGNVQSRREL